MQEEVKPVSQHEDYPLTEIPLEARRGFWSNSIVLLGFTFFTATMFGGGSLGTGLKFWPDLVVTIITGNLLLGLYVAVLSLIAYRSGLNTVLMCRFSFGDWGSKWSDLLLGLTQIGWYAWGTATIATVFVTLLGLPHWLTIPLMVVFGMAFCWTAWVGYRGLEILSLFAVPVMTALILWSMTRATRDVGGLEHLLSIVPSRPITIATAITIVFGTFVSGGTQSPNWSRFSNSTFTAAGASLLAFFVGNGLMISAGAYGALVYQEADIVQVLKIQGVMGLGVVMLLLNIWTTQDNTIYNFSVAGCNLCRTPRRRVFTIGGAAVGTILAIVGMGNWLVPYLVFLGTIVPPLGGVIMADYWIRRRGQYQRIADTRFPRLNIPGVVAYILASILAFVSGKTGWGVPPINGIIIAVVVYVVACKVAEALSRRE
ncbi:MAG: cytosine permease [Spartobacteria bacterium]|nr:cytosine permease [Spartobacteria bacterium]